MPERSLKAVFLDRDGVLNDLVDRGAYYMIGDDPIRWTAPFTLAELRIKPFAEEALRTMAKKGYLTILVTNQPDLAGGLIAPDEFRLMMEEFCRLPLDDTYICLHRPSAGCPCRKPAPGMIIEACAKHGIDPALSYMIGDNETDIEAGRAVGAKTILVSADGVPATAADHVVADVLEAAMLIA